MVHYSQLFDQLVLALMGRMAAPTSAWHARERTEQRVAAAVCEAMQMTPERWDKLTPDERVPWLDRTLTWLATRPKPNAWRDDRDMPIHLPDEAGAPEPDAAPAEEGPARAGNVEKAEGGKPDAGDAPDGPFGADGFRFAGVEVRFGRAAKQYRLVLSLWDSEKHRPGPPRPVVEVMSEVWGEGHDTEDGAFRDLCSTVRRRFQAANCPLTIQSVQSKVQLARP